MPTIRIEMLEGRTDDQKRAFARAVSEAAVRDLRSEPQHVDVVFFEVSGKNWATGGVFFSEVGNPAGPQVSRKESEAGSSK